VPPPLGQPTTDPLAFAAGGGEMGERLRAFEWSKTPLGALESWPQSLRSAVSFLLPSRAQIVLFWGRDFTTIYNDAYRPVFGAKHPTALGLPARESWSEIWDSQLRELLEGVRSTGEAYWASDLAFFVMRYGYLEETYFDVSYDPVRDETGDVGGVLCIVTETTLRVQSERRLGTLRDLSLRSMEARTVEAASHGAAQILAENAHDLPFALIYPIDPDGRSARLAGNAGLSRGSAAAPTRIDLAQNETAWPFAEVLATRRPMLVTDLGECFGALPGGVWPEPTHSALVLPIARSGNDQLAGFLVAGISPRRAIDDTYRDFLGLVGAQIATAIASARAYEEEKRRAESLAALDRAKTAFFSNVSHEFRTPLTLMLGPVEDLLAGGDALLPATARAQLAVVNRNGMRLLRLVNTLLDFSRIEAGRVRATYQPIDLAAYTSDLASNFRSACERAGLRLIVDCGALTEPAFVDREMWEKIVLNLLSNAFKFTFEGEITVSLHQVGDAAELEIRDTGTGIPTDEIPRLFERFHRVENARGRTHEGSGIGLALVSELVRLHHGSIVAASELDKGTKFTVTIPLGSAHLPPDQIVATAAVPAAIGASPYLEEALRWLPDASEAAAGLRETISDAPPLPSPTASDERRPLVLVADDNADMRQYLSRLLEPRFRVEAVSDGEAALDAARARAPDLVLTDVMMPRLDGFDLLRAMRAEPGLAEIPIVMLSARAGEEARIEGAQAGADDYLTKPFSARELVARVDANVKMAAMRRKGKQTEGALVESEQRLRLATDAGHIGIAVWDMDANRVAGNEWLAEILGLDPDEVAMGIASERFTLRVHEEDRPRVVDAITRVIEEGGSFDFECRIAREDGVRWVHVRGRSESARNAGPGQLANTLIDITGRKEIERALRQADRRKDEFLAILAHELRNPLATIRNALAIFEQLPSDPISFERTHEMMDRQVKQMVRLVEDLLDVSRIGRGTLELRRERVALAEIVDQALETCRPLAEAAGHELFVTLPAEPIVLDADPIRLRQVFANLLNNACKFTETGGQIRLTAQRADDEVIVAVQDTGVGIPDEEINRIFELFEQVDKTLERSRTGLGIGLSLVKKLVELHGGTISAHSDGPDRGSRFVVRLPVAE
jgi:PAS domain S-box-containing protein